MYIWFHSYCLGENFDQTLIEFQKHMAMISEWFYYDCLKANAKQFHLFLSPSADKVINIESLTLKPVYAEVYLGVTNGSKLNFS